MPEVINGEVSVPGDTLNGEINPRPQNASPQNSETEQGDPAENVVEGWPDLPLSNELASASRRSWRFGLVSVFVFIGWAILVTRLIQLQGAQRQLMNDRVARQSIFGEVIPARPGEILDRNGQVLALTIPCDSLFAVPEEISDPWDFAWRVGPILQLNADEVYHRIVDNADKRFVWIQRRISDAQVATIRELNLPKTTWGLRREYQRQYPQGSFASHVLGIRNIDNAGQGGLEQSLHDLIRGVDGNRVMTRDARGIVMEVTAERSHPPKHGQTVVSTIDLLTQIETERQLDALMEKWKPLGACAIVMAPRTGEILAMASRPGFDPNALLEVPAAAWKNLAVSAVFEPGSTFKPFIVGWAIQHKLLAFDEMIDCSFGLYRMGPRILHDHHAYGALSVEDVLVKSSNIGMAKIGERMGLESLYEATRAFGFGRRTGIELPGELSGLLRPVTQWNVYSLGSIPMGQELAVTPLQLITAHAALANGGRLVRPHLLRHADSQAQDYVSGSQIVEPGTDVQSVLLDTSIAEWLVQQPLKQVVERGTGKSAKIAGLSIFGKTGTAQKLDLVTGTYSDKAWVLSFVCGTPAESPEVLVLVMVDEPTMPGVQYGGTVAAPTASRILQFAETRVWSFANPRLTTHDAPATRSNHAAQ
ncbi:MAG: penicillin-binding protein 2 [Planctomycetota bacterium]|nr:MAG: penicillin-binding protein 2 [Planctomycetota bacterium]